jgi:hypothetical protein
MHGHGQMMSPSSRAKSMPHPGSGSQAVAAFRSKSSPQPSGRSLRSGAYQLRSRDSSTNLAPGKGKKVGSGAAGGHIKASVATGDGQTFEDHEMVYYSTKHSNKVIRSPSVASHRSRARSARSARSSRTNTHVSDHEDEE